MKIYIWLLLGAVLLCAVFALKIWLVMKLPPKQSIDERLSLFPRQGLPISSTVHVSWDDYQIPFIDSETEEDAAFVLGLVHAHLRLAQIEGLRMVSQGRLSEMLPISFLNNVDAGVRALGFGRAVSETYRTMPQDSRVWLDRFVEGLNYYKTHLPKNQIPYEVKLLGIDFSRPFTAEDILTIGKLSGASPSWFRYFSQIPLLMNDNWREILALLRGIGMQGAVSHLPQGESHDLHPSLGDLEQLFLTQSRSGSNALVIAPEKSMSGAALIAGDPHLGMSIPNFWLMVGMKTPKTHAVGMMVPGVPAFGLGRTPHIAWGGTNLHGQDSDLIDVTDLPKSAFTTETHRIKRRFLPDKYITIRISPYGPVLSDLPFMPQAGRNYAFAWVGHRSHAADELTALRHAAQAENFQQFQSAMAKFATPGQNFLYADKQGNIAQIVGSHIPKRDAAYREKILIMPEEYDRYWQQILNAETLPYALNPAKQYLTSANNRPYAGEPDIGYSFSSGERVLRMESLLEARELWDVDRLKDLQRDDFSALSLAFARRLVTPVKSLQESQSVEAVLQHLQSWDGHYAVDSVGAATFELFLAGFAPELFRLEGQSHLMQLLPRAGHWRLVLKQLIDDADEAHLIQAAEQGIESWRQAHTDTARNLSWGDLHYLNIQHMFGNIPRLGKRYQFSQIPLAGSNETIFKTGHDAKTGPAAVTYGTQSRHISDMSDIDENYFVLLGGQDVHIGSDNFADLALLWARGELIRLPLSDEGVSAHFHRQMSLTP